MNEFRDLGFINSFRLNKRMFWDGDKIFTNYMKIYEK